MLHVAQPDVARAALVGMRVAAVRHGEFTPQVGAVNMVVGVIPAQRRDTSPPTGVGPCLGPHVVGIVVVHGGAARPVVTVKILAVADRAVQRDAPQALHPARRSKRRLGLLPLVGIVGTVESVRTERTVLVSGLDVEESGAHRIVVHAYEAVPVFEIGVVDVAVAAAVRTRREERETPLRHGTREVSVGIAVLAARTFEAQVGGTQRHRADVHRTRIGAHARHSVDQFDARHAVEVDGQRMGLMPRAGIGEIDSVEHDHGLVEGASADRNVGLHPLAAALAQVDRRNGAQRRLQGLEGRGGRTFAVEKRSVRHRAARGAREVARNPHFVDLHDAEHRERIGGLRLRDKRRRQEDRHRNREDSECHRTMHARKDRPALAIPPPEAESPLRFDFFHLVLVW